MANRCTSRNFYFFTKWFPWFADACAVAAGAQLYAENRLRRAVT